MDVVYTAVVCAVVAAAAALVYGVAKGFYWFVTKGGMVNAAVAACCVAAVGYGTYRGLSGEGAGWWVLCVAGLIMGGISGLNLREFISGREDADLREKVIASIKPRTRR